MHDELRDALRRVEPPAGFAERVMRLAPVRAAAPARHARTSHVAAKLALAATLVAAVSGGLWYRAEEKRKEGEEARRQVLVSLNIAGSKLRAVAVKINHEEEH